MPIQSQNIISLPTGKIVAVFDTSILRPIYKTALERDALKTQLDSCSVDGEYLTQLLSLKEGQLKLTNEQVFILKEESAKLEKQNAKQKTLLKWAKYSILLNCSLIVALLIF